MTLVSLIVVSVLLTGCIGQLPGDSLEGAENMDLTLAGDIERESRRNFSQNVVSGAVWNAQTGSLHVQGLTDFDDDDDISILNATTRQVLLPSNFRVRRLDDDDDGRRGIVLNNLSTIPCSITVTTSRGVQQIPVQNAPFNCAGAQIAPLGGVNITEAKWSNSSARLSVKGSGALPNQVVSVFDTATGLYLGSDQANSVGSWRVRVRNVFPIPCSISASANGLVAQARVANAPVNACSGSLGGVPVPVGSFPPAFPSTGIGSGIFGAAPESVIQSPLTDLTIPVGT
ncbi:MAG: hypothetical protein OEX19_16265, partial [Gammaproteobacteria bacterium]|nr:hypothetical protein [Gammaproteobacteria bacterium]